MTPNGRKLMFMQVSNFHSLAGSMKSERLKLKKNNFELKKEVGGLSYMEAQSGLEWVLMRSFTAAQIHSVIGQNTLTL